MVAPKGVLYALGLACGFQNCSGTCIWPQSEIWTISDAFDLPFVLIFDPNVPNANLSLFAFVTSAKSLLTHAIMARFGLFVLSQVLNKNTCLVPKGCSFHHEGLKSLDTKKESACCLSPLTTMLKFRSLLSVESQTGYGRMYPTLSPYYRMCFFHLISGASCCEKDNIMLCRCFTMKLPGFPASWSVPNITTGI